jgi:hypothetical protein
VSSPTLGRQSRRDRRELSRQLAKQIMQSPPTADRKSLITFLVSLAVGFASVGYQTLFPQPNAYVGSALLFVAFFLLLLTFWNWVQWNKTVKALIVGVLLVGFAPLDVYWFRYFTRPSFVYMHPGVWLDGKMWDFILNHRGPDTTHNVEILFIDKVARDRIIERANQNHTSLTPQDIESYQQIWRAPEVNPKGRGRIFAQQFLWTPQDADHERYELAIKSRDRTVNQELQIERVSEKWYWASKVTDSETGELLIDCNDRGFPNAQTQKPDCFPAYIKAE